MKLYAKLLAELIAAPNDNKLAHVTVDIENAIQNLPHYADFSKQTTNNISVTRLECDLHGVVPMWELGVAGAEEFSYFCPVCMYNLLHDFFNEEDK